MKQAQSTAGTSSQLPAAAAEHPRAGFLQCHGAPSHAACWLPAPVSRWKSHSSFPAHSPRQIHKDRLRAAISHCGHAAMCAGPWENRQTTVRQCYTPQLLAAGTVQFVTIATGCSSPASATVSVSILQTLIDPKCFVKTEGFLFNHRNVVYQCCLISSSVPTVGSHASSAVGG